MMYCMGSPTLEMLVGTNQVAIFGSTSSSIGRSAVHQHPFPALSSWVSPGSKLGFFEAASLVVAYCVFMVLVFTIGFTGFCSAAACGGFAAAGEEGAAVAPGNPCPPLEASLFSRSVRVLSRSSRFLSAAANFAAVSRAAAPRVRGADVCIRFPLPGDALVEPRPAFVVCLRGVLKS